MNKDLLRKMLVNIPRERNQLLPALHVAHDALDYLPAWSLEVISDHLGVPGVEIESIAHSYSELRLDPPPSIRVGVCTGLSCWLKGSSDLLDQVRDFNGPDSEVELEELDCAFMCGVAPGGELNGMYIARARKDIVTKAMSDLEGDN